MALIECALAGSPIVAYRRDLQGEFIEDQVNGLLVSYRDRQAMGEKALAIIRDPALRDRLSRAVRASAIEFVDPPANRVKEHAAFDAMFDRFRSNGRRRRASGAQAPGRER
jgi:glycosyltransferase involved in cell wall biosynthesis